MCHLIGAYRLRIEVQLNACSTGGKDPKRELRATIVKSGAKSQAVDLRERERFGQKEKRDQEGGLAEKRMGIPTPPPNVSIQNRYLLTQSEIFKINVLAIAENQNDQPKTGKESLEHGIQLCWIL